MNPRASFLAVAATAALGATGRGDTNAPAIESGPLVHLEFAVLATGTLEAGRAIGDGATHPNAIFMTAPLGSGQSHEAAYLELRIEGQGTPASPCTAGALITLSPPGGGGKGRPRLVWSVQGSVVSVATDRIEGRYTWQRLGQEGDGESAPAGAGAVALREDDRVLLDFLHLDPAASPCYRNAALELRAKIAPPDRPLERLSYDLWLVGEGPSGRTTRHLRLAGTEGEKVTFDYGRLWAQAEPGLPKHTMVTGQVRGRLAPDGTVDLAFLAERQVMGERWAVSAHGRKQVKAALGETLRLDLPPPNVDGIHEGAKEAIGQQRVSLILTVDRLD